MHTRAWLCGFFASILGSYATFQLTDMGVLDFGAETLSSIFAFMILGGIAGFGGSMQDNSTGFMVRKVLGVPARALASAARLLVPSARLCFAPVPIRSRQGPRPHLERVMVCWMTVC